MRIDLRAAILVAATLYCNLGRPKPLCAQSASPTSVRHWAITDMAFPGDKDDVSVLSALMLVAGAFDMRGVTVGAKVNGDGCNSLSDMTAVGMIAAYDAERANLDAVCGGYPSPMNFIQASTCSQSFDVATDYSSYDSVARVVTEVLAASPTDPLYVSLWGPTTEGAAILKTLIEKHPAALQNLVFTGHGTTSGYNYKEDEGARDYLQSKVTSLGVRYYETGPTGQRGLVEGSRCTSSASMSKSHVGRSWIGSFLDAPYGKWHPGDPNPDFSDAISWWILPPFHFVDGGISSSTWPPDGVKGHIDHGDACQARDVIFNLLSDMVDVATTGVGSCPLDPYTGSGGGVPGFCGDGFIQGGEACDDANNLNGDGCDSNCNAESPNPICGNGLLETGEACDDGNDSDTDTCTSECALASCTDGLRNGSELEVDCGGSCGPCGSGNLTYQDLEARVGGSKVQELSSVSGYISAGYTKFKSGGWVEMSFTAPTADTYDISFRYLARDLVAPVDIYIDGALLVDDMDLGSGSVDTWQVATRVGISLTAGPHTVRLERDGPFAKVDSMDISGGVGGPQPVCGNGLVEVGEQCDDGNAASGDGCDDLCVQELPSPVCGNGIVEGSEGCDDGNLAIGDGCGPSCELELGSSQSIVLQAESADAWEGTETNGGTEAVIKLGSNSKFVRWTSLPSAGRLYVSMKASNVGSGGLAIFRNGVLLGTVVGGSTAYQRYDTGWSLSSGDELVIERISGQGAAFVDFVELK